MIIRHKSAIPRLEPWNTPPIPQTSAVFFDKPGQVEGLRDMVESRMSARRVAHKQKQNFGTGHGSGQDSAPSKKYNKGRRYTLLRLQDRLDGSRSYDSCIQKDGPWLPASMPSCRSVTTSDLDDPYQPLMVSWVRPALVCRRQSQGAIRILPFDISRI